MKWLISGGLLCGLLYGASSAQAQGPNLSITNFSVWSTLPGPDGQRRMAISFRVVNNGTAAAGASTTRITVAGNVTTYPTPALAPKAAVFFTQTLLTTSPVAITLETNVPQQLVNAPESKLQNPGLGVVGTLSNGPSNTMQYTANPAGDYGRWEAIGPSKIAVNPGESGRVTTIAVSPTDPTTLYAGGRDEGLWKTQGPTITWFPIADALPTLKIDAVALDPGNPNRVMVVTPAGVFQSLNGGSMWQQLTSRNLGANGSDGGKLLIARAQQLTNEPLAAERSDARVSINPFPPSQAIYVSTSSGLQVSTDGGVTWNPVLTNGFPVISLQFGTTDATGLFASTGNPPAAYEAQNGGLSPASWHKLQGCPQAPLPIFPSDASEWITESQGTQWISFRGSSTDSPSLGLWRSTSEICKIDGFLEHGWEPVTIPVTIPPTCSDYTNHWSYLFAHPTDPTVVFKGGIKLCRSSASGDNMTELSGIHDDQHAVVVAPSSPSTMFFGSDGGIYRSSDKGATLTFIGEGMYNTEVLNIDVNGAGPPRVIVGGSQDNDSFAWDGSSPVWTDVGAALSSGDVPLVAFDRTDHKNVYTMGQSTQQIQDHPLGGSSQLTQRGSLQDCDAYTEFPGQVFESMQSTGVTPPLLVTCTGIWSGPPWNEIKTANGDSFVRLRLAPDNPQIAVAATASGHVYWGAALQPSLLYDVFTAPNGFSASAIAVANEGTFYVANSANGMGTITRFTCLLGCTTENIWPPAQNPPAGVVTAVGIDPLGTDTVLVAILGNGIYQGTRDGSGHWTWVPYNNGIPMGANITDIEARNDGSIAAAAYGRGVFLLSSRSTAPPPPPTLSAIGYLVSFEVEGGGSQPGKPIPRITTARLDSKPGFVFTSLNFAGTAVLQAAFTSHHKVQITYTPNGQDTGKILGASYAGP
jgi:hypothetical protein